MKITPAFRRYVKRVERDALKGKLDAIRTLGAIALALSTMTMPGHAATFADRFVSVEAPAQEPTKQSWTIRVLFLNDGKLLHVIAVPGGPFPSSDACKDAIAADTELQAAASDAAKRMGEQYGDKASVALACAMELN
jgi:hypothetical protein